MAGEQNRLKMADLFKQPMTWKEYCEDISTTNCANDTATSRAPQTEEEGKRFFFEGAYTGYFKDNDCSGDLSASCTGHIADYPCSWPSYVWEQTQYLNIALESRGPQPGNGGYALAQMEDIWRAANATKSSVVMQWWTPQALHEQFHGSDAEFTKVNLPTPTEECLRAREQGADRCDASYRTDAADLMTGSCDTLIASLYKMKTGNLYDLTYSDSTPRALQSPAFEVYELFQISEHQLTEIFTRWKDLGDPHEAVCEWAVENMDYMKSFIPNSYPRTMISEKDGGGLRYAAMGLAGLVMVLVICTAGLVYSNRTRRSIVLAQVDFLGLLLAGDLLISTAALLMVVSTSDPACVTIQWAINIGYTLELVPLLVKVSAITRLAISAQKMRRHAPFTRQSLFQTVAVISTGVLVFMILWTVLDPPQQQNEYILTDDTTEEGSTIVEVYNFCKSGSSAWYYASAGWMTLMLLSATVLAVQMRKVQSEELKESGTLATVVYFHAVFVLIRLVTYFLDSVVRESILIQLRSLIFSVDGLSTVLFYVMPKFFTEDKRNNRTSFFTSNAPLAAGTSTPFGQSPGLSGAHHVSGLGAAPSSAQVMSGESSGPSINLPEEAPGAGVGSNDGDMKEVVEVFVEEVQSLKALLAEKDKEIEEYKCNLKRFSEGKSGE